MNAPVASKIQYIYEGSVLLFGREILGRWTGQTLAVSERKARSNLAYQVRTKLQLPPRSPVTLPGRLTFNT